MSEWIDGRPPCFGDDEVVLIVAEIPSLFVSHLSHFEAFRWHKGTFMGGNEYIRAKRWCRVPLPPEREEPNHDEG